jgi:two-component system CheB/CheR fusion protein
VVEAEDGMIVTPGCIYLSPPDKEVNLFHGFFRLTEVHKVAGGIRLPIDFFFRSLAQDWGEHSVGIILSGTGTDGTAGLKAIKGAAGMAMVQDTMQAQYSGMPQSAIDTGIVDFILPVEKMPAELIQYIKHPYVKSPQEIDGEEKQFEDYFQKIFMLIRAKTGHDFSNYKQNTIRRRIERRMAIHKIVEISNYVRYLQEDPIEVHSLFKDLLIKVTNFFRDGEAFDALRKEAIRPLLEKKPPSAPVRVWVPGCASGEEAYSIAMLFAEVMDELKQERTIQIFASDIDAEAISQARAAQYADNITADVPEERIKRFFLKDDGTYKIKKQVRQMVVFAAQNVLTDPPFTKLDLISCRNLLIYLESSLQKKLLPLFHYSLNQGGYLFLGTSETIGESHDLFFQVDKKWKIYHRRGSSLDQAAEYPPFATRLNTQATVYRDEGKKETKRLNLRDLAERITLENYAPSSVIINEAFDILYFQGQTDRYLSLPTGDPRLNILNMARMGLGYQLKNAVNQALKQNKATAIEGIHIKENDGYKKIDLVIMPLSESSEGKKLFMVFFIDKPADTLTIDTLATSKPSKTKKGHKDDAEFDPRVSMLEERLRTTREDLQSTIEELETSNEELKSANEELQSSNEESQSTNEELETSREELQSTNEELSTVNAELQNKVEELSKANDDINNILASTDIATIFFDKKLNIRRFTPAMTEVFNLIPSDVGRPITDITSKISSFDLYENAKKVLTSLQHIETHEKTGSGRWYSVRIRPYRTTENVIDGVVLSFLDITEVKKSELVAQAARVYTESIVNAVREPLVILDSNFKIVSANRAFYQSMKISPQEAEKMSIFDFGGEELKPAKLRELLQRVITDDQPFDDLEATFTLPGYGLGCGPGYGQSQNQNQSQSQNQNQRTMLLNARSIPQEIGSPQRILLAMEDITEKECVKEERGEVEGGEVEGGNVDPAEKKHGEK